MSRLDQVGGKLAAFTRDGFVFDTGPSLLTLPAVYRDLFLSTGAPLEESVELVEIDPAFRYRFPATQDADAVWLDVPNASRARLAAALDDGLGTGAGADWGRFLDRAHDIWQATRGPFLESPLTGGRDLLRMARRTSDVRTVSPWLSLRSLGKKYLRDPRLRLLLDRYATYTGSDPRRAPAALAVVPYVEQTFGAWHVRGGVHRLGVAVHERALLRGATVRTGADVRRVVVEGGRAAGVELTTGERIDADVVVSDADATRLYDELVPGVRRSVRAPPAAQGDPVAVRLRAEPRGARPHARAGPPHRAVPGGLRRGARRGLRARRLAGDRPDRLRLRARRPGDAAGGPRVVVRPGQRAAARRRDAGSSTGTRRAWRSPTPTGCWR